MRIILAYGASLILVSVLLAAIVNFQSPPSVYEADLMTRVGVAETKIAQIIPTQEFFYTTTPTLTPTRTPTRTATPNLTPTVTATSDFCIGTAAVDTGSNKLNVRNAPNGSVVRQMTNGTAITFIGSTRQKAGSYTWVKLVGKEEWVALEFLWVYRQPTCW